MKRQTTDSQRAKVYKAERIALAGLQQQRFESVEEIEQYLKRLYSRAWFKKAFPKIVQIPQIEINSGRGGAMAFTGLNLIRFTRYRGDGGVPLWLVLHETAHILDRYHVTYGSWRRQDARGHGRGFCATYILLVARCMGKEAAAALKESFKAVGVKFYAPKAPRTLTEEQRAVLRDRLAHARTKIGTRE